MFFLICYTSPILAPHIKSLQLLLRKNSRLVIQQSLSFSKTSPGDNLRRQQLKRQAVSTKLSAAGLACHPNTLWKHQAKIAPWVDVSGLFKSPLYVANAGLKSSSFNSSITDETILDLVDESLFTA